MSIKENVFRVVLVLSFLTSISLYAQSQPKAWYVDKRATGLNNGTSWINAWNSFSSINWSLFHPGDTLFISGGLDSVIYTETLTFGNASGSYQDPITITKGKDLGHNGQVIIDGEGIRPNGIKFNNNNDYIIIDGLNIRNTVDYAIEAQDGYTGSNGSYRFKVDHHVGITIKNCKLHLINSAGIALKGVENYYGTKNVITTTASNTAGQTDGYWIQACKNVVINGDSIIISNRNPIPHCDGIQTNQDTSTIVKNCYIQQRNSKTSNAQGIYMTEGFGVPQIFNNVVYLDSASSNAIAIRQLTVGNYSDALIFNNTVVNSSPNILSHAIWVTETNFSPKIQNNIVASMGARGGGIVVDNGSGGYEFTAFNLQYNQGNVRGTNAITSNPLFIDYLNKDFRLQESSPGVDAGSDLSTYFNYDKLGTARPQGFNWDLGAFEYRDNLIGDNISPQILSASLIDSVTLNLIFSEPLEPNGASNPANYFIDNGINIINANWISNNNTVRLQTSVHNPGFYTITVSNVTDTAGNVISPQNNSATYGYNPDPLNQLLKFIPVHTSASSIPEPEHLPEKTFDGKGYNSGDPSSRWAGYNLPQWIGYDLGDIVMLSKTRVQFYNWENGRIYNYSIQVSLDSLNWNDVRSHINSQSAEWSEETFEPVSARFVRILVHSNNQNNWASLWETEFYGQLMISNNDEGENTPSEFKLEQNYPNPFNPTTKISWQSPVGSWQTVKVFDILGNEVATLVDEYKEAGRYEVEFDASNLSSGVYIYRLQADKFVNTRKMILLR